MQTALILGAMALVVVANLIVVREHQKQVARFWADYTKSLTN